MSSTDPLSPGPDSAVIPVPPPPPLDAVPAELEDGPRPAPDTAGGAEVPLYVAPLPEPEPAVVVPARPPHPNFWWGSLWCLGFFLFLNGSVLAAFVVILLGRAALDPHPQAYINSLVKGGKPTDELVALLAPAYLVGEVASVLAALLVVRLVVGRRWPRQLSLGLPSVPQLALALAGMPALLTLPGVVHHFAALVLPSLGNLEENARLFASWPLALSIVVVGILPGVGEELWCRGFLGRGFVGHYGWLAGIGLTSLWFGLLHVDPPYVVATAVMGVWLHYVYLTSRSLPLSMLLHGLNNSLAVIFAKYSRDMEPVENAAGSVYALAALAVLLAVVAWGLYRGRARLVPLDGLPPWRPAFPGVEAPPAGSATVVARPGPGLLTWVLVLAALASFAAALAYTLGAAAP